MGGHERGRRFTQRQLPVLYPYCVTTEEVKWWALTDVAKGHNKHMFTRYPNSSHDAPATPRDTVIVSKTGPTIAVGLQQLKVLR
jgi:hypothetical protein